MRSPPDRRSGPWNATPGAAPNELRAVQALTARQSIASGPDSFTSGGYDIGKLPSHIAARITFDPATGCWPWTGSVDKRWGHGRYSGEGAYRVVWRHLVGPVDPGLVLDHVKARGCATNACVNPDHLEPVTPAVNTLRGDSPPAVNARKTCCDSGHEFTEANTYVRPDGHRDCRRCICDRVARYRKRQRAERLRDAGDDTLWRAA